MLVISQQIGSFILFHLHLDEVTQGEGTLLLTMHDHPLLRFYQARDTQEIDWGLFSSRVLDELVTELLTLQEDLEKAYDEPKSVEMRYFDLSIRYHELYGFFFDLCGTEFLLPAESLLNECKSIIDKKEV